MPRKAAALLLATCIVVPLVFTISVEDTFALPKMTALWIVLPVALALAVIEHGRRSERRGAPDHVSVAVAAFLGLNVVAFLFSRDPVQSLIGERLQYQGLLAVVLYGGFYLAARMSLADERRTAVLFGTIGTGAVVVSAYALLQLAGLDPLWGRPEDGRVFSTIGQPNALAAYLALAIPLTSCLLPRLRGRSRGLVVAGVAVMIVTLAATLSRAGYVALGVAGLILLPALLRAAQVPLRRLAVWATVVALIAILLAAAFAPIRWAAVDVWSRAASSLRVDEDVSIQAHLALWSVGWRIALDHPLVGAGQETFPELYPLYRRPVLGSERARILAGFRPESPHNVYLAIAGGAGFPALLAYLAVVVLFVAMIRRSLRSTNDPRRRLLLVGALAAVAAHLVTDFFMTAEVTGSWLFWTVLGATTGMLRSPGRRWPTKGSTEHRRVAAADMAG
jgi:O-antigen ligase